MTSGPLVRGSVRVLLAATLMSNVLHPGAACAQVSPEDQAASERLFDEGRDLIARGDMAAACERFQQSQEKDPRLGTLLYLATCHEQTGKTATAHAEFTRALAQAETEQKADRITQAKDGVTRVEATLSKVLLRVTAPASGQKVRVNGAEVTTLDAALPYDPGELVIEAEAPDRKPHTQKIVLEKGPTSIEVSIPELATTATTATPPAEESVPEKDLTLAFIVGGAGIGVTTLGFVFGGVALATSSSAEEQCRGTFCNQEGLDGHAAADGWAWASNVTVGLGLAAVGAGVVLFFLAPDAEGAAAAGPPAVSVLPTFVAPAGGGGVAGITGVF